MSPRPAPVCAPGRLPSWDAGQRYPEFGAGHDDSRPGGAEAGTRQETRLEGSPDGAERGRHNGIRRGVPAQPALSAGAIRDLLQTARGDVMTTDPRSALSSDDRDHPPGPLAGVKRGATSDPGYPQPQAAEVESARLPANPARQRLRLVGFSDQDIDRLADDFIAEDRGEATRRSSAGRTMSGGPSPRRHTALSTPPGCMQARRRSLRLLRLAASCVFRLVGVGNGRWPRWPEAVVLQRWCGRNQLDQEGA
jgi:hypothetical protein